MRKVHPPRRTWASCTRGGAWLPVRAGPRCHPHPAAQDSPDCGGFEWLRASALPRGGGGVRRCHPAPPRGPSGRLRPRAAARPAGTPHATSRFPVLRRTRHQEHWRAVGTHYGPTRIHGPRPRLPQCEPRAGGLTRSLGLPRSCGQHGNDSDCAGCGAGVKSQLTCERV